MRKSHSEVAELEVQSVRCFFYTVGFSSKRRLKSNPFVHRRQIGRFIENGL